MSLADHIKKQDERRKELAAKLHDLGCEFAEYMGKFDLMTLPITDATGEVEQSTYWHWENGTVLQRKACCEPTGMRAFPLILNASVFLEIMSRGGCIAVKTDGELLFTESQITRTASFCLKGTDEKDGLVFRGSYLRDDLGASTWQQLREKEQNDQLFRLSDEAYTHGLSYVIEPIELAMLKIYNSAQRR
jgi:hypothetical protein